jgi:elongator complex protein 3
MYDPSEWLQEREYTPETLALAKRILVELKQGSSLERALRRNPLPGGGGHVAKHILVAAYRQLVESGEWPEDPALLAQIRMKPMRTLSGVTTVTVLTKPYPCPGKCIFCPTDTRMPKSYLPDEPGAARAFQNEFDPYKQVRSRLDAYQAVGHPTDKIELLILGGTWSAYRRDYQEEFIRRCFDAMNEVEFPTLAEAHKYNETAAHRNVGLVIETRPDEITPKEIAWLRHLGVTKVQLGVQSLDDTILEANQRGHTAAQALKAAAMLRAAGFKIVVHWMPNLLGATPESDREDFTRLWKEAPEHWGICPDEIKIYPTQLLELADLYAYWQRGEYHPYTTETLVDLIADIKPTIPEYCRVNRVIRDIPSTHVVAGNKRTSLRQDVLAELARRGQACRCIRCREVRGESVRPERLELVDQVYHPANAEEHFLYFRTPGDFSAGGDRVAGYLRLSLPERGEKAVAVPELGIPDLDGAALIREVHVYGQALAVGAEVPGAAQHAGLGTALLEKASTLARDAGYAHLAVIAAVGTRRYYEARGFERRELYMVKTLKER